MKVKKLRPIVLAGGSGKRLWPLSTKEKPKQFISLFGDYSLFDLTLQRLNNTSLFKKPIIVTSKDYLPHIKDSYRRTGIEVEKVILEPESKNTFSAISLATMMALIKDKEENFLVAPSDHYLSNNQEFYNSTKKAASIVINDGLILFGVKPSSPSTEYGYIQTNEERDEVYQVSKFVEKPSASKAKSLIKKNNTFWNAGIFVFKGSWLIEACKDKHKMSLVEIQDVLPKKYPSELYFTPDTEKFSYLLEAPFDKAFVEKNNNNIMLKLDAGWSDLGSWVALSALQKDLKSQMTLFEANETIREEKPWGYFETLMETVSSKVKLLSISPGHKLSLQKHRYRSETWYVINGKAKVTKGNERYSMVAGDSVIIEANEQHRLENISETQLEIIEIQTGTYFGEDDIVRLKDSYGREDLH